MLNCVYTDCVSALFVFLETDKLMFYTTHSHTFRFAGFTL